MGAKANRKKSSRSAGKSLKFLRDTIMEKMNPIITYHAMEEGLVKELLDLKIELSETDDEDLSKELSNKIENHPFTPMLEVLENDEMFPASYAMNNYGTTPTIEDFEQYVENIDSDFNGDVEELIGLYIDGIVNSGDN